MLHARSDYDHIQDSTEKIKEDEPVFLLRAQDQYAPDTVCAWCHMVEKGGDRNLSRYVRLHAVRMQNWQTLNNCKKPDIPVECMDLVPPFSAKKYSIEIKDTRCHEDYTRHCDLWDTNMINIVKIVNDSLSKYEYIHSISIAR